VKSDSGLIPIWVSFFFTFFGNDQIEFVVSVKKRQTEQESDIVRTCVQENVSLYRFAVFPIGETQVKHVLIFSKF
jgi:hypothetical protein